MKITNHNLLETAIFTIATILLHGKHGQIAKTKSPIA
jgi:hypothetical protein